MARLEDLLTEVEDGALRAALGDEVKRLKKQVTFGLVFERHLPESVLVGGNVRVGVGDRVRVRKEPTSKVAWEVMAVNGKTATIGPTNGHSNGNPKTRKAPLGDLLVVRDFGDPVFPALVPLGEIRRSEERASHVVINSENYHALEALIYAYEGQVDCIFIDPPYNAGFKDWKYNNDYVDKTDTYRHSKWLSFIEKRLRLAKRLLKDDGVLVVTVDEHEGSHLGVLLETMFPDALRQMVTICINPSGASRGEGLSRVEEYAYFCFLGGAEPSPTEDDMLVSDGDVDLSKTGAQGVRWEWLMRGGNAWYRENRENLCYPIILSKDGTRIVGAGEPYAGPAAKRPKTIDGHPVAWPVRKDGRLGIWRVDGMRLRWMAEKGYAYVSSHNAKRGTWTLKYLMTGALEGIEGGLIEVVGRGEHGEVQVRMAERKGKTAKTIWYRGRHIAGGAGGTQLLSELLGQTDLFPYPKSVYAVQDCLQVAVGNRPDAFIVDFFAGSGTSLHAAALMNARDGGNRRCVLVTNNEVDEKHAKLLNDKGHYRGDSEFERQGIFEAVTRPRCEAAITGKRADGQPVPGAYLGGRPLADGFEENCAFFRLEYLDLDDVELGRCFAGIHPLLWLRAGSRGPLPELDSGKGPFAIAKESGYAVLFDETAFREFVVALNEVPEVEHVFLVTDSEDAFAEMCGELGHAHRPEMLYRDYARTFRSFTSPTA